MVLGSNVTACDSLGGSVIFCENFTSPKLPSSRPVLLLLGGIFDGRLDGHVGGVGVRQRQVGDDVGILDQHRAGGGEPDLLPQAGIAVATACSQSHPMVREKGGAVDGGDAAVLADTVGDGVLVGNAGMRLRRDLHGQNGCLAGLYELCDVESAADESALDGAHLGAVHPHLG